MSNLASLRPPGVQKNTQSGIGSFARALAETDQGFSTPTTPQVPDNNALFGEALARTGGNLPQDFGATDFSTTASVDQERQRLEEEAKQARIRAMHERVNPVDLHEVYRASEKRTQEELDKVRQNLAAQAQPLKHTNPEIIKPTIETVVNQGQEGKGLRSLFDQVNAVIVFLLKKANSAQTWNQEHQAKAAKQRSRKGPGAMFANKKGHAETKAVFDTMHHERSTAYGGA